MGGQELIAIVLGYDKIVLFLFVFLFIHILLCEWMVN